MVQNQPDIHLRQNNEEYWRKQNERKTRREWDKLQQQKNELTNLKTIWNQLPKSVDMLVERLGFGKEEQQYIHDSLAQIQEVVQEASAINIQSGWKNYNPLILKFKLL